MILRSVSVTVFSLLMVSGLFAQQKVGTSSGPRFLLMSPSVKGIAMGQTAVTSYDSRSYYFNPGTLALIDVQRGAVSFNPASSKLGSFGFTDFKSHTEGIVVRLANSSFGKGTIQLAFGYMFTTWSVGPFVERTFQQGGINGTGRVVDFTNRGHSFSIAGAYKGSVEIGLGTTVRYIKEDIFDLHADGVGFDVGTMFRLPLIGSLSRHGSNSTGTRLAIRAGASVTNFGSGLSIDFGAPPPPGTRRVGPAQVPLPTRGRFGMGLDFVSGWLSLSPVAELTVANNNERGDLRVGMEAGLFNTLFARAGRVDENDAAFKEGFSETSYGFGFSTIGVRELATESTGNKSNNSQNWFTYLSRNLNLTFSFAHLDSERIGFDDPNYYQIEITL